MTEKRTEKRLRCWESVFKKGVIEGKCPVCQCSLIRYHNTTGTTFQQLHIISNKDGGGDESWNLIPGCGCNQNMKHMNLVDWMGTRGNKHALMKKLFISKYKSLVAPCHRSPEDRNQLIEWIRITYKPGQLDSYSDWLILLKRDLDHIQDDDDEIKPNPGREERRSPHFDKTKYNYSLRPGLRYPNLRPTYQYVL